MPCSRHLSGIPAIVFSFVFPDIIIFSIFDNATLWLNLYLSLFSLIDNRR